MNPEVFRQAAEIFTQACSLRGPERDGFVAEACAGHPELHDAVTRLLEHDDDPVSLVNDRAFDGGGVVMLAADLARDAGDGLPLAPHPDRIGRYRILRVLGQGGMGVVYEAEQDEPRRRVALKVIRRDMATPSVLRRFRQESDLLGRLRHPGIAEIHEAGTHDDGHGAQPFFAMELVVGPSITRFATTYGLDVRGRLELIAATCDAVHHAHQQGIIHRDLKPENVMVITIDADGRKRPQPKILDFGVARATDADLQAATLVTSAGQILGTLAYMSPEQAGGDPADIDARSDVYALGVILYELLSGRLPYPVLRAMIHEAIRVIREEEPSRLTTVDRSLRGDIETIVGRAMEKDKNRRYQTAADLAADIRRYLANEPILARPATSWYHLRKFTRRHRTLVTGVAMTLITLVAGVIVATTLAIDAAANAAEARWEAYRVRIAAASAQRRDDPASAARTLRAVPPELRGWEWYHLASSIERHAIAYRAPVAPDGPIAIAGGGAFVIAPLVDGTVAVWDTHDATLLHRLDLGVPIRTLAASVPGPSRVALGTAEGDVILCDPDGTVRRRIQLEDDAAPSLAWDPAGERLAVVSGRRLLLVDEHGDGDVLELDPGPVRPEVAFSPDGRRLAGLGAGELAEHVFVWEVAGGLRIAERRDAATAPRALTWSADGSRLVLGTLHQLVVEMTHDDLQPSRRLTGHRAELVSLASAVTGDLASCDALGMIRLWRDGVVAEVLEVDGAASLIFTPDGTGLVFDAGDELRLWDLTVGFPTVLDRHTSYVYHVSFSPDGARLASGAYPEPEVVIWDPLDARAPLGISIDAVRNIDFLEFTRGNLVRIRDGLFDPATGFRTSERDSIREILDDAAGVPDWQRISPAHVRSPDGAHVAVGSSTVWRAGPIQVLDAAGEIRLEFPGKYWAADFSPDGRSLALAADRGTIEIRDLRTGELLRELSGHEGSGAAYCVAFHPDGRRLASGGNDGTIRLWDTAAWQQVHEMRGHASYVKSLAFSPDGTQLASGSGDFTVRIWDTVSVAERASRRAAP